ncbi:MAG: hypothetical protein ACTSUT_07400 [Promethearchaeota archaeon]
MTENEENNLNVSEDDDAADYVIDFTTSSAISRVNIKFLAVYIPIFWLSGLLVGTYFYEWTRNLPPIQENWVRWIIPITLMPLSLFFMYFIFILGCLFVSKLLLILVNLIHKPKEGIFIAEIGDTDFEFWCLRNELKKITLWLTRNCPLPWIDVIAFRWFGIQMDFSSHLQDAWVDCEFIKMGRKVLIGQGAVVMSSMVIGKYLIIKKIILDDYALVGGQTTIAPGTIFGRDTVLGAVSVSIYNQFFEPGWIYTGIPGRKFKPNKISESKRDRIAKKYVDEEKREEVKHDVNIEDKKRHLLKPILKKITERESKKSKKRD